jgi:sporulation protein YlmC with PRC-barrel domain
MTNTSTRATHFTIGADATCSDGFGGEVTRVVVDPLTQTVTHLVVEPKHRHTSRLVPLDLVDCSTGEVHLRCTVTAFDNLDAAEETHFILGTDACSGYGSGQVLSWPYYGLAMGMGMGFGMGSVPPAVTSDTIPVGEVAIRRGESVHATDGDIGRVHGLVINPRDRHVTHVLLQEGHLWGRKDVAIPIGAVTGVAHGIELNLTKREIEQLPPVDIDRPSEV